jgi:endonuclease III
MKNATKHADDLRGLLKRLTKENKDARADAKGEAKGEPRTAQDPLKALVRAAMGFDVPDARAEEAMRAIEKEFVDLNELRVATDLEIQELLGTKYPSIERRVAMITQSLHQIFEREHTLSLDRLRTLNKRDARQFLRELPDIHPFVDAYVMLFSCEGHAVPLDEPMLDYLREQGIVEEGTPLDEAQKFLEHAVKAEDCYDLYACLRRAAAGEEAKAKKKAKA